ncbi:mandelate racemase/muconate lactonizing enzyme family protein [Dictyobacter formicarum]|uniref:Mandelate racemase n=1 Tax=Dictyobacter formicarum TaxID=2778368 RepID=A0ABQ3VRX0_9CHLR|nr:mandelate racemase/muconate lactonizing enzyme family protein [Dictyobacter formicarum]GHO88076.1 mandelate racemase [Dictyobacter formicarum]
MKITKVESFIIRTPIRRDIGDSTHMFTHWSTPGCWITTDEGLIGTGYTGLEGNGEELIKQVIDQYYAPKLLGRDPFEVKRIWEELQWGRLHWIGRAGVTQMALSAVDIALWDIMAQAAGVPLWKLLGGDKPQAIKTYNTDGGWLNWTLDELVTDTRRFVEQGWPGVKIKIGSADPWDDYRRVKAVREAIGDDILLMVDANMVWDVNTACLWGKRLEEFHIHWLEEPLHPDDIAGHARLARELVTPIALGENLYHRYSFRDYITTGAVEVVQADVTRVGGITEWVRIANLAACFNVPVVPHVGDMMQIQQHLVAATPNAPMLEYIPWILDLFEDPVVVERGHIKVPDRPGASTRMRSDSVERWRVS